MYVVFNEGFKPKGTHNDPLLHTSSTTTPGDFVSTSPDIDIAKGFTGKNGWVYVIETENYVDQNATYGASANYYEQHEISIKGAVDPSDIVGAYKTHNGQIVDGSYVPNPNYGG